MLAFKRDGYYQNKVSTNLIQIFNDSIHKQPSITAIVHSMINIISWSFGLFTLFSVYITNLMIVFLNKSGEI